MASGRGQLNPAASARTRYSNTVVRPAPVLQAISRTVKPAARSRRTSLIFLMGSLFLGTWSSLSYMGVTSQEGRVPALVDQGTAYPGATSGCPLSAVRLSGLGRIRCPDSSETSVRFRPYYTAVAKELGRLGRRIEATGAERRRLADLYQAGVLGPDELAQRAKDIDDRRSQLSSQREELVSQRGELASGNRLRQRLEDFAGRVLSGLDQLDFAQRQRLMRLVVEAVHVKGWSVEIRLRVPLDEHKGPPRGNLPSPRGAPDGDAMSPSRRPPALNGPGTTHDRHLSSEERLRSIGHGAGVPELDVLCHVSGGQHNFAISVHGHHRHGPILMGGGDDKAVPVAHPLAVSHAEVAVVVPGHDDVALPGHRPVGQGQAQLGHLAGGHPFGAGQLVQLGHCGVVDGEHQ